MSKVTGKNYANYYFEDVVQGDGFRGSTITTYLSGGLMDLSDCTEISFVLKSDRNNGTIELTLSNGDIEITDIDGVIQINETNSTTWAVGTYYYDITFTIDSKVRTRYRGTLKVITGYEPA